MGEETYHKDEKIKFLEYSLSDWLEVFLMIGLFLIPVMVVTFIRIGWLRHRLLPSILIIFLMLAGSVLLFFASFASAMGGGAGYATKTLWAGWVPLCLWVAGCLFLLFIARCLRKKEESNPIENL
jgi:tellurite resistance protein TehA-like permease